MKVANLVALDDFGGLQTLYLALALHRAKEGRPLFTINRAEAKPLDIFSAALAEIGGKLPTPRYSVSYRAASHIPWGLLERLVKSYTFQRSLRKIFVRSGINCAISWNAVPSASFIPPGGHCVLYDHGFSSIHKPTRTNRARLSVVSDVVAISKANARLLEERWEWRRGVKIISNPLRQEIAVSPLVQREGFVCDGCLTVGCASRLVSFKGIVTVVHAVAILKQRGINVVLRIAGDGSEAELIKQTVQDLGASDFVKFDGIVSDMPRFFSEIDIFVAPSLREPFGLSPMEALASGVPTILSNVDGHTESLPFDGAAIVLDPVLPLSEYTRLGASLHKMPAFVYSPIRDCLTAPMALDPGAIADAIAGISDDYTNHAHIAFDAGSKIRDRSSIAVYAERFSAVFESANANPEPLRPA